MNSLFCYVPEGSDPTKHTVRAINANAPQTRAVCKPAIVYLNQWEFYHWVLKGTCFIQVMYRNPSYPCLGSCSPAALTGSLVYWQLSFWSTNSKTCCRMGDELPKAAVKQNFAAHSVIMGLPGATRDLWWCLFGNGAWTAPEWGFYGQPRRCEICFHTGATRISPNVFMEGWGELWRSP